MAYLYLGSLNNQSVITTVKWAKKSDPNLDNKINNKISNNNIGNIFTVSATLFLIGIIITLA